MEKKDLPVYKLDVVEDDDSEVEVDFVALVDKPAIEKTFLTFKAADVPYAFAVQDEEERIISGPLMLADKPIYRIDNFGEYYVYFTADTIKKIVQKLFRKGYQSNVNLMHDGNQVVNGVTMFESWIVDREKGKMPMKGFEDAPDGSWFGSYKVNNDEVWADVKAGKYKGFSVEGIFNYIKSNQKNTDEEKMRMIIDILKSIKE